MFGSSKFFLRNKESYEMKSIVNRIVVLLATVSLTGVLALGQTIEKEVTFRQSLGVNGTKVEQGTYKVAFNEETGELTIRKGKKVVATAPARLEKTNDRHSYYTHSATDDPPALVSVSFKDGNVAVLTTRDSKAASSRP